MKFFLKAISFLIIITITIILFGGATGKMNAGNFDLPKTVGIWHLSASPRVIHARNIFNYMNGAGELYLSYRFRRLEVFEYTSDDQDNILVELYFMETSDDAFGLISLDWGGDPVSFDGFSGKKSNKFFVSPARGFYGGGLLRLWSDYLYARVLAEREMPASKKAVLDIGKAITEYFKNPPEPDLIKILPLQIDSEWKLRTDRLSFFRSYLVLNSIYYISHEDILDLDLSTEGVTAPYERISSSGKRERIQFVLVQYESAERSRKALNNFHDAYLPEYKKEIAADSADNSPSFFKLEDGWLAYKRVETNIAIVFECPDQHSARAILGKNGSNIPEKRGSHEY